ncbi:hypothetical protein [Limosilactobacillus equigenerosi]|uniref:hypothetical protein n=1 Tax=Limosilactobacillus equigenerosi TaxID=417373 RepID=UPI0012E208A3|nr:hypothetical protein [Limosilactobacillus equigenerosi]
MMISKNKMHNLKLIMKILSITISASISILAIPLLVYEVWLHYSLTILILSMVTLALPLVALFLPLANIFLMVKVPTTAKGKFFYALTTFLIGFYVMLIVDAPNYIYTDEGGVNKVTTNDGSLRRDAVILGLIIFFN